MISLATIQEALIQWMCTSHALTRKCIEIVYCIGEACYGTLCLTMSKILHHSTPLNATTINSCCNDRWIYIERVFRNKLNEWGFLKIKITSWGTRVSNNYGIIINTIKLFLSKLSLDLLMDQWYVCDHCHWCVSRWNCWLSEMAAC